MAALKTAVEKVAKGITDSDIEIKDHQDCVASLEAFFVKAIASLKDIIEKLAKVAANDHASALAYVQSYLDIDTVINKCSAVNLATWTKVLNKAELLTAAHKTVHDAKLKVVFTVTGDTVPAKIEALKKAITAVKTLVTEDEFVKLAVEAFNSIDSSLQENSISDSDYLAAVEVINCKSSEPSSLETATYPKATTIKKAYEVALLKVDGDVNKDFDIKASLVKIEKLKLKVEDGADETLATAVTTCIPLKIAAANEGINELKALKVAGMDDQIVPKVAQAITEANRLINAAITEAKKKKAENMTEGEKKEAEKKKKDKEKLVNTERDLEAARKDLKKAKKLLDKAKFGVQQKKEAPLLKKIYELKEKVQKLLKDPPVSSTSYDFRRQYDSDLQAADTELQKAKRLEVELTNSEADVVTHTKSVEALTLRVSNLETEVNRLKAEVQ